MGSGTAWYWLYPVFSSFHGRELWIKGLNKPTLGIMSLRGAVWHSWAICLSLFELGSCSAALLWILFLTILDTFIREIHSTSVNLGDFDRFSSGQRQHSKVWVEFDLLPRPLTCYVIWLLRLNFTFPWNQRVEVYAYFFQLTEHIWNYLILIEMLLSLSEEVRQYNYISFVGNQIYLADIWTQGSSKSKSSLWRKRGSQRGV